MFSGIDASSNFRLAFVQTEYSLTQDRARHFALRCVLHLSAVSRSNQCCLAVSRTISRTPQQWGVAKLNGARANRACKDASLFSPSVIRPVWHRNFTRCRSQSKATDAKGVISLCLLGVTGRCTSFRETGVDPR